MSTIQLTFGTLSLDSTHNITIKSIAEKAIKRVKTFKIPVQDGSVAEEAKIGPKEITIEGDVAGSSYDDLRTNIDSLHAGLLGQGIARLTKDDERYIDCQLKSFNFSYDHLTRRMVWTARFVAHYPFWLAVTATTDTRSPSTGVGYSVTNAGNAPTRVKVEITPTGVVADDCQFENTSKGQLFSYEGTIQANNKLEVDNRVDTDDFEVLNDGSDDHANFVGDFITLDAGSNTVEYTGGGNPEIILTWRDAWY